MRLIDADYLMEKFEFYYQNNLNHESEQIVAVYSGLSTLLMQCPAAYDINKVIVRLSADIDHSIDIETGELLENWVMDMQNNLTESHISIVSSAVNQDAVLTPETFAKMSENDNC